MGSAEGAGEAWKVEPAKAVEDATFTEGRLLGGVVFRPVGEVAMFLPRALLPVFRARVDREAEGLPVAESGSGDAEVDL